MMKMRHRSSNKLSGSLLVTNVLRALFFFSTAVVANCTTSAHDCDIDDDCCSYGAAFLCQDGACSFNGFVANDPRVLGARQQICGGRPPVTAPSSTGSGQSCQDNPEEVGTAELGESAVSRDACEFATQNEIAWCESQDGLLASFPKTPIWNGAIGRLKQQAGIDDAVEIDVVPDLQTLVSAGGGATGTGLVVVDGKFLDILFEYAHYVAMAENGETSDPVISALDGIVAYHDALSGQNVPPGYYAAQSPEAQDAAVAHFDSFAGAILYHEFGHYWSWACIDSVRFQYAVGTGIYYWPSKVEDDADLISGVLSAKAGHAQADAIAMIDLMAFYTLYRQRYVQSFADVEAAYIQYVQMAQNYSSLAGRKQLIQQGYADWAAFGAR